MIGKISLAFCRCSFIHHFNVQQEKYCIDLFGVIYLLSVNSVDVKFFFFIWRRLLIVVAELLFFSEVTRNVIFIIGQ